jgi:DNA polymerase III gamma/tau subunit
MSLYNKHRPQSLDEMLGNPQVIESLRNVLARDRENIPHSMLFLGPSGCGKTTLARIVAAELGCNMELDFKEVDSADFRGIDSIRDLRQQMRLKPMAGPCRVFFLDECFAADTPVVCLGGVRPIQDIQPGELVQSMQGFRTVLNHFVNKVPLERTARVHTDQGDIRCSREHLFRTTRGWVPAGDLREGDLLYPMNCHNVDRTSSPAMLAEVPNDNDETVPSMQYTDAVLSEPTGEVQSADMLQVMCSGETDGTSGSPCQGAQRASCGKDFHQSEAVSDGDPRGGCGETGAQSAHAARQPVGQPHHIGEGPCDQDSQGLPSHMEGGAGREREDNRTSTPAGDGTWLADGSGDPDGESTGVPEQLQGGHRKFCVENCRRSGRTWAQVEAEFTAGYEKDGAPALVRVGGVALYESGGDAGLGPSDFTSDEIRRGFVEYHDLEIDGHPSYFAGGVLVHNCHKLTNDAQNALLKGLEHPPGHVFVLMATTEPQKLLPTVKTRLTTYEVSSLTEAKLIALVNRVCRAEKAKVSEEVVELIARNAVGSARLALSILEALIDLSPADQVKMVDKAAADLSATIELCRALMGKGKLTWAPIATILRGLADQDEESIRRSVLGYFTSVLIKGDNPHAALVLECFKEPYYASGRAGLVLSCYAVVCG